MNSYRRPPSDNLMKPDTRLTNWELPDNGTNKQMVDGTDNWIAEWDKQVDNFMKETAIHDGGLKMTSNIFQKVHTNILYLYRTMAAVYKTVFL